jgi:hypothetical protein
MSDWLKEGASPTTCKANPGQHIEFRVALTNGVKKWQEEENVLRCMGDVLVPAAHSCTVGKSWIELEGGFIVQPRFLSLQPLEKGGVQTVTTVEVSHSAAIPAGVFEFQHSSGDNARDSIVKGFDAWMKGDLPVFLDAVRQRPQSCTYLQIDPGSKSPGACGKRRVVLGPVAHLVTRPAQNPQEAHPFCPCCLFTKTGDIWKEKISGAGFYGIRLFAMKDPNHDPGADCRVNGEDWEAGKAALVEYIKSWPDRGVEYRKQYIIIQDLSPD